MPTVSLGIYLSDKEYLNYLDQRTDIEHKWKAYFKKLVQKVK